MAWQGELFVPVVCRETAAELIRVLSYPKFRLEPDEVKVLLAEILPYAETFAVSDPSEAIEGLADASDAVFAHLARQAKVDWLVSGDVHLLDLKDELLDGRIISPGEFLGMLDNRR